MGLRRSLMALVLVAAPLGAGSLTFGQSASLPTEVVMTTASLNPSQQEQVNQFVRQAVDQLLTGEPSAVSQGRRRLLDTFAMPGVSDMFLATYSPAISRQFNARNVMEHESTLVRTNVMIVASKLSDGGVVALIRQGLADKAPGVRYWAAMAASQAGPKLNADDQKTILNLLGSNWQKEAATDVLEKMLLAMDALQTPEAGMMLLQALNYRVNIHAGDPTLALNAEFEGLQGVTVRTFTRLTTPGQNVDQALLRQLVIVLFRYFDLATALQANPSTPPANMANLQNVTKLAGNFLPRIAPRLDVKIGARTLNPADINANRLLAEEWRQALTAGSSGISRADLVIQAAATPEAPAQATEPAPDAETPAPQP